MAIRKINVTCPTFKRSLGAPPAHFFYGRKKPLLYAPFEEVSNGDIHMNSHRAIRMHDNNH